MKQAILLLTTTWLLVGGGTVGGAWTGDMPLVVTFSAADPTSSLHEPVYIDVTIENPSADLVHVDLGFNRKGNYQFTIETPRGLTVRPPRILASGIGRVGWTSVGAGQVYEQRLLLNEWYQPEQLGDYSVKATLATTVRPAQGPPVYRRWSAELSIRVLPYNAERLRSICEDLADQAVGANSSESASTAALTLSFVRDPVALPYLERVVRESCFGKELAIRGLGRIGGPGAMHALRSAMTGAEPELKALIQRELRRARAAEH